MVYIITGRKTKISTGKPIFTSHFNRELCDKDNPHGKYISSEKEYAQELKKRNLEPYDPSKVRKTGERPMKPSKWARDMVNEIKRTNGNVGSSFYNEIKKKGINVENMNKASKKAKDLGLNNSSKGGFV